MDIITDFKAGLILVEVVMFLPFIPFIIVLAGISILASLPPAPVALLGGWEITLLLLGLLLLGVLMGNLSRSVLGSRSPMRISRRRMIAVGLWMLLLGSFNITPSLKASLSGWPMSDEIIIIILLVHFWIYEALALIRLVIFPLGAWPEQGRLLIRNMGVSLPILVMVLVGIGASTLAVKIPALDVRYWGLPPWLEMLGGILLYSGMALFLIPPLITFSWRLKRLDSPEMEEVILTELKANGVSVAKVLNWPEDMLAHATAGVIGLIPPFRYLLFANRLANALTPEEVRSITAHEAAHLKYRHLFYFFLAIFSFLVLTNIIMQWILLGGLWLDFSVPPWLPIALEIGGLLLFLRYGVGFLSRHFERQADCHALLRQGFSSFETAILKIGHLNRIPTELDNWHHYGIGRRLDFLRNADKNPQIVTRHHRGVVKIKIGLVAVLALCLVVQAVFSSTSVVTYVADSFWIERMEEITDPSPADHQSLNLLANQAYQRGDFETAERYFRRLLDWSPNDPAKQNNLAWLLVTGSQPGVNRVAEGLDLAKSASSASPSAYIWDTLAEAYFRSNQPFQAITAAEKALRLAEEEKGRGETPLSYYQKRLEGFNNGISEREH